MVDAAYRNMQGAFIPGTWVKCQIESPLGDDKLYSSEMCIRDRYCPLNYPLLVVVQSERRIRYAEWSKI